MGGQLASVDDVPAAFLLCGSRHGLLADARSPRKRPKLRVCAGRLRQRSRQGQIHSCISLIQSLRLLATDSAEQHVVVSPCRILSAASAPASDPCDGCAGQTGGPRTKLDLRQETPPLALVRHSKRSMEAPLDPGISLLSDDSNPACHSLNLQLLQGSCKSTP